MIQDHARSRGSHLQPTDEEWRQPQVHQEELLVHLQPKYTLHEDRPMHEAKTEQEQKIQD